MSLLPRPAGQTVSRTPRQEEILAALETVMTAEGFRSLTIADLAERLHCSRRTLYELADSKDDLVALVVSRFLDRNFARGATAMADESTTRDRIEAFAAAVVKHVRSASTTFGEDVFRTPRTADLVAAYDHRCVTLVQGLITEGAASGEVRAVNSSLVAHGLMAAIARIQDPDVLAMIDMTYPDATREMVGVLLDGIVADEPAIRP
jgi:AcrR family transcriptional regulator